MWHEIGLLLLCELEFRTGLRFAFNHFTFLLLTQILLTLLSYCCDRQCHPCNKWTGGSSHGGSCSCSSTSSTSHSIRDGATYSQGNCYSRCQSCNKSSGAPPAAARSGVGKKVCPDTVLFCSVSVHLISCCYVAPCLKTGWSSEPGLFVYKCGISWPPVHAGFVLWLLRYLEL